MLAWARNWFKLEKVGPDGVKVRAHLQIVKNMGIPVPELDGDEFPAPAGRLWRVFLELTASRQSGYGSPQPITYAEILAYDTLMGGTLAPWEVSLIKSLDILYFEIGVKKDGHSDSIPGS